MTKERTVCLIRLYVNPGLCKQALRAKDRVTKVDDILRNLNALPEPNLKTRQFSFTCDKQ
jgi:hypothetical protein